jgi:hypothetical protein
MKNRAFKTAGLCFLALAFLTLCSCASPRKADYVARDFNPASIKTIGIFPITYDKKYPPPFPQDTEGRHLSTLISRGIERVLTEKGYKLQPLEFPAEILKDENFVPLKVQPSVLTGNDYSGVDGLMQIHVTFHYGIEPRDRSSDNESHSRININATARLIDVKRSEELWRDGGRARPITSTSFTSRLNYATYTLAEGLFKTLPDKGDD